MVVYNTIKAKSHAGLILGRVRSSLPREHAKNIEYNGLVYIIYDEETDTYLDKLIDDITQKGMLTPIVDINVPVEIAKEDLGIYRIQKRSLRLPVIHHNVIEPHSGISFFNNLLLVSDVALEFIAGNIDEVHEVVPRSKAIKIGSLISTDGTIGKVVDTVWTENDSVHKYVIKCWNGKVVNKTPACVNYVTGPK